MLVNDKRIEKTFFNKNKLLYFIFSGSEKKENIDYEKLNQIIDQCFENLQYCDDMIRNISRIRTIFKDFDESYLEIHLFEGENKIIILYVNKLLFRYEETNEKGVNIRYTIGKGISYFDNNFEPYTSGIIDCSINKIEYLKKLESVNSLKITYKDKILYQVYKLFYGETPDFSASSINVKFQMMLLILEEFGISFDYDFNKGRRDYPVSFEVTEFVNKMKLFGEIEDDVDLSEENKRIIQLVGNNINEYINNQDEPLKVLIKLGTILYTKRNCTYGNQSLEELEYIKILSLIKKLNFN